MQTTTAPLTPLDMLTLTMLLTVGAALGAALIIHHVWPKTEPTPTALIVFVCAMIVRTAAAIRETAAAGWHPSRATIEPESYALWIVFCLVLWLLLMVLALRDEQRAIVAASREAAQAAHRLRTPPHGTPHVRLDHMPGDEWAAYDAEERDAQERSHAHAPH